MKDFRQYTITLPDNLKIKSLVWHNDYLIDFAGGHIFSLDGKSERRADLIFRFDDAIISGNGKYVAVYERYGTKAIILKDEQIIREINRPFTYANSYEYPIALFSDSENTYLAHCPNKRSLIEIEEIETGKKITDKNRTSKDFFQSRLQISPNQKWLLSAGWIWNPIDSIELFDLSNSLTDPEMYDFFWTKNLGDCGLSEIRNAVFLDDENLLFDGESNDHWFNETEEPRQALVLYNFIKQKIVSKAFIDEPLGKIIPINSEFIVGFYDFPKLVKIKTGEIVHKWEKIQTDRKNGCFKLYENEFSYIASDFINKRFAVSSTDSIEIICFK